MIEPILKIARGERLDPDGKVPTNADRLRALDLLARYGFREPEPVVPRDVAIAVGETIGPHLTPDTLERSVDRLLERLKDLSSLGPDAK